MSDQPFKNEKLPGEPIIVNTTYETWEVHKHHAEGSEEVIALMEEAGKPIYYICDMRRMSLTLQDIIKSANMGTRDSGALLTHPLMKEFLVVTNVKLIELAAKGLSSDIFGNVAVKVFETPEDALAYAREQVASEAENRV